MRADARDPLARFAHTDPMGLWQVNARQGSAAMCQTHHLHREFPAAVDR